MSRSVITDVGGPVAPRRTVVHRTVVRRTVVRRTVVLRKHNALILMRDPGTFVAYSIMSVVLLTVLRPVYERLSTTAGAAAIYQEAPGIAVMFTLPAMDVAGQSLLSERTWNTWDRLRAGSVGTLTVLVGKVVPLTALFVVQQAVLFVVAGAGYGFDLSTGSWRLALLVVCWGLCVSCCGLALGVWVRTQGQLAAAADVGALAVTCLSGCLVPLAILPHWVAQVAPWTLGYWALHGFQSAVTGDHATYDRALAVVVAIACAAMALAAVRARHAAR